MTREFLMLAQTFDPDKHRIAGWYVSEKLDGQRCFWDGGASRGKPTKDVPWANLNKKVKPVASGLWTRYGNVVVTPDWFLDLLPIGLFLDGELYCGNLQILRSIVSTDVADQIKWRGVKYLVFDSPGYDVFGDGTINDPHFKKEISFQKCVNYLPKNTKYLAGQARDIIPALTDQFKGDHLIGLDQEALPFTERAAKDKAYELLAKVTDAGGEGLMLRDPRSVWFPKRVPMLLKMKPMKQDDAIVKGIVFGKDRLRGMIGALRVEWNGILFDLGTGLDDHPDRELNDPREGRLAEDNPGDYFAGGCKRYPYNSVVEFKYTSLTNDGVPREARFSRIKPEE